MNAQNTKLIEAFEANHPRLTSCMSALIQAAQMIIGCYQNNGKLLVCGNGGSAADSDHIVGELMKGFCLRRELSADQKKKIEDKNPKDVDFLCQNLQQGLPAISLTGHSALITAFLNDVEPSMIFAQQVLGYGKEGDVLIGLSTSGNSKDVVQAIQVANSFGIHTIGFTGMKPSKMSELCEITLQAPQHETYLIQEDHIRLYHLLCLLIENELFG